MSVSQEIDEFLATHTRTMLVTLRDDGSPTVHPMLALWREGALWFNTYRKSAKTRNIERDPRVCCLVLGGDDDLVPPAVVVHGTAELMAPGTPLPGGDTRPAVNPAGVSSGIVRKVADRVGTAKRIMFRVEPTRVGFLA
ncbi:MAG: pyridoxamine 5'-phosphate oxidase family protein [Acidimicrobiia bacterium]